MDYQRRYTRILNKVFNDMQAQLDKNVELLKKSVQANQDKDREIAKLKGQIKDLKAA